MEMIFYHDKRFAIPRRCRKLRDPGETFTDSLSGGWLYFTHAG